MKMGSKRNLIFVGTDHCAFHQSILDVINSFFYVLINQTVVIDFWFCMSKQFLATAGEFIRHLNVDHTLYATFLTIIQKSRVISLFFIKEMNDQKQVC